MKRAAARPRGLPARRDPPSRGAAGRPTGRSWRSGPASRRRRRGPFDHGESEEGERVQVRVHVQRGFQSSELDDVRWRGWRGEMMGSLGQGQEDRSLSEGVCTHEGLSVFVLALDGCKCKGHTKSKRLSRVSSFLCSCSFFSAKMIRAL